MNKSGAANVASQARHQTALGKKASKAAAKTRNCRIDNGGHVYGPDPANPDSSKHRACVNCGVTDFHNDHIGAWVNDYNEKQNPELFNDRRSNG